MTRQLEKFEAKDFSCDQEALVCISMDCFRMAMGMETRNFAPAACVKFLQLRFEHHRQNLASLKDSANG